MSDRQATRQRILAAAYRCVVRRGLGRITMEDAAREASLSRATVYRHFPGGREQLVDEVVAWEIGRFFERLLTEVGDVGGFAERYERGLVAAHRLLEHHAVLQRLLQTEADELLPSIATTMPLVHAVMRQELRHRLDAERLRPGVDPDAAADFLARMALNLIGTQGHWDLTDPVSVRRLVRGHLLSGILA